MNDININDISMYGEHGVEMINDNIISRHTAFSSEKIIKSHAGGSNPNILHNWDFRHRESIVNQRRQTEYRNFPDRLVSVQIMDRWYTIAGIGMSILVSINNGFVRMQRENTVGHGYISQIIEFPNAYAGETYTFSMIYRTSKPTGVSDIGNMGHTRIVCANADRRTFAFTSHKPFPISEDWSIFTQTFTLPNTELGTFDVGIVGPVNGTVDDYIDIQAVKLELGSISTLANDPPMDFGKELAICQRYQFRHHGHAEDIPGVITNNNNIIFTLPLPVTMRRTRPTIAVANMAVFNADNRTEQSGFTFYASVGWVSSALQITAIRNNHGLTNAFLRIRDLITDANL